MTVCFIGHRKIENTEMVKKDLIKLIFELIKKGTDTFLFGSKSEFDSLCYEAVSEAQQKYPYIKKIYIRSAYPHIDKIYENHLYCFYEETYFPDKIKNAGKASYVERNQEMINKSDICVFYYNKDYLPPPQKESKRSLSSNQPNSGTKIAYNYAVQKKKHILNIFCDYSKT